ncbi:alpha/beta hydrolase [Ruminococcus sp. NK3A76]|uniref:alpha/beta hydrolase n=1 Tax=Ruminococcus sp. NK3A76 TaxID=877411 RepID=UPI00048D45DF|nr:alpha/beta hydrolase [Ruminococcus sp. NK3A76]
MLFGRDKSPDERCAEWRRRIIRILLSEMQASAKSHQLESVFDIPQEVSGSYEIEEILNIPYMNRHEVALGMDIYKPVMPETAEMPVIVTLYGGGLVQGDRKSSRPYARELASRGYLVFAIEYRLVPKVNCTEQFDDVCAGLDLVGRKLIDFNVDFSRLFLTGSSAGAFLALYVAAMKKSEKLQKAIGHKASRFKFKAVGLDCGMLYTNKQDPVGLLLADLFYGEKRDDPEFLRYTDPENPEIIDNLPPVFLNTSRGDFINKYTLTYHKALKKAGKPSKLVYYGDKGLFHAFVGSFPWLDKSRDAIDKMLAWFEEQADIARERSWEEKPSDK